MLATINHVFNDNKHRFFIFIFSLNQFESQSLFLICIAFVGIENLNVGLLSSEKNPLLELTCIRVLASMWCQVEYNLMSKVGPEVFSSTKDVKNYLQFIRPFLYPLTWEYVQARLDYFFFWLKLHELN